jgi:7-cyano-7-deazaguanine synthase in queuosine biosynthesis
MLPEFSLLDANFSASTYLQVAIIALGLFLCITNIKKKARSIYLAQAFLILLSLTTLYSVKISTNTLSISQSFAGFEYRSWPFHEVNTVTINDRKISMASHSGETVSLTPPLFSAWLDKEMLWSKLKELGNCVEHTCTQIEVPDSP